MNQTIVSVIIAAYNAEKWVRQCLDSVLAQTLHEIEIICVDDGSNDATFSILKEYELRDSRVHSIHQEHQSAGAARNHGLSVASGKYLSFLDADDFFEPEMLKDCVQTLEREESDIVIFPASMFYEQSGKRELLPWSCVKEYLPRTLPFSPDQMQNYLFNAFQNWAWNKVFRRDYIVKYGILFQDIPRTNDMAFVCEALACARKISILDVPYANYRTGNSNSLQSSNHLSPLAFWSAFLETKHRLEAHGKYELYKQSYLNWVLEGALQNIRSCKDSFARMYIMCFLHFECEPVFHLADHPREYYYHTWQYKEYIAIIQGECIPEIEALNPNVLLRQELEEIKSSKAYRIGSALAYIPRKIRKLSKR